MVDDDGGEPAAATQFDSVVGRMEAHLAQGRPSGAVEAPPAGVQSARISSASGERDFVAGLCTGIAVLATAMHLWLAYELTPLQQLYREVPDSPTISRFAISAGWRYGSFGALVILILFAYALAPRRRWPLVVVAILAVSALAFTHVVSRLPLFEIAGNIRGE
jgi:hypothetical protein